MSGQNIHKTQKISCFSIFFYENTCPKESTNVYKSVQFTELIENAKTYCLGRKETFAKA